MARKAKTETPAGEPVATLPRTAKIDSVIDLLRRAEGATLAELTGSTGWQAHSARAVLTGLKKKGHIITRDKRDDVTCYRISEAAAS